MPNSFKVVSKEELKARRGEAYRIETNRAKLCGRVEYRIEANRAKSFVNMEYRSYSIISGARGSNRNPFPLTGWGAFRGVRPSFMPELTSYALIRETRNSIGNTDLLGQDKPKTGKPGRLGEGKAKCKKPVL